MSPWNNVAIRPGGVIDGKTVDDASISAVGSVSGVLTGECHLSDDSRTLIFMPLRPYALGETVSVRLQPGPKTLSGEILRPLTFKFSIASWDPRTRTPFESKSFELTPPPLRTATVGLGSPVSPSITADDLPNNFPTILLLHSDNPEPGYLFFTPRSLTHIAPLLTVDSRGMPLFFRRKSTDYVDFKVWPNGKLTYYDLALSKSFALDSLYAVVDSFAAGNGYRADFHDFQLLPNGHSLLVIYDPQPVDMSQVVPGGDPNAFVTGVVVQELDASKNVVFQWRSWDHFQITDARNVDLTALNVDPFHINAVEMDTDGNIMISCKHLNEITKINRQTGAIIWRWGLNAVHNDFTFVGDTRGFAYQHDIRRTPDGDLTVYDNGSHLNPQYSRALEYAVNEQDKTATLVREYLPDGGGWDDSNANVQKRASGNTLVSWGAGNIVPDVTEFRPDGSKMFELRFDPLGMTTYRAFRFVWQGKLIATDRDSVDFGFVRVGGTGSRTLTIKNNGSANITITSFVSTDSTIFSVAAVTPIVIVQGQSIQVPLQFHPHVSGAASGALYVRSTSANQLIARAVEVKGVALDPLPAAPRPHLVLMGLIMAAGGAVALRGRRARFG